MKKYLAFAFRVILPIQILFAIPSIASATTIVVNSTNDDLVSGSMGYYNLRTAIQEANALPGRDIIIIGVRGIFKTPHVLHLTDTAGVCIIGPGSENFAIDGGRGKNSVFILQGSNNNVISGLRINNIKGESGISIVSSNYNTFNDVVLDADGSTDTEANFFLMDFYASCNNTVTNCKFICGRIGLIFRNCSNYNTVLYCSSDFNRHSEITIAESNCNVIRHSHLEGSSDYGMFLIYGSTNNIIEECTIVNNALHGIICSNIGADSTVTSNNIIRHNIIAGNQLDAISIMEPSANNLVISNVVANNNLRFVDNTPRPNKRKTYNKKQKN